MRGTVIGTVKGMVRGTVRGTVSEAVRGTVRGTVRAEGSAEGGDIHEATMQNRQARRTNPTSTTYLALARTVVDSTAVATGFFSSACDS